MLWCGIPRVEWRGCYRWGWQCGRRLHVSWPHFAVRGSRSVARSRNDRMLLSISCRIMGNNRQGARKMDVTPLPASADLPHSAWHIPCVQRLLSSSPDTITRLPVLYSTSISPTPGWYNKICHDRFLILLSSTSPFHLTEYEVCGQHWSILKK
jgi:hypothetical protein